MTKTFPNVVFYSTFSLLINSPSFQSLKTSESDREHKQAGGNEVPKTEPCSTSTSLKEGAAIPAATPATSVPHKGCEMQKTFAQLSDRQSSLKERLNVLSKRLFRYKTKELVRHIVSQLDKFDEHAIKTQVSFIK